MSDVSTTQTPDPATPPTTVPTPTPTAAGPFNQPGPDAGQVLDPTVDENKGKTEEQVAQEVLAGQWGRGHGRRHRLQLAGYDPDAVGKAVQKQLTGQDPEENDNNQ